MHDQTSEQVVIPDMAEPLTNESESNRNLTSEDHKTVSGVATVESVVVSSAVPVSQVVGSLINVSSGTTFNVITPDQLQLSGASNFKPLLCVDNSCICDSQGQSDKDREALRSWNGTLKATHIVIQDGTDDSTATSPQNCSSSSWTEYTSMPILPVRCKTTSAELHKIRFGSGGRGRCIKVNDNWYTPSEFEAACGRASSKDWKRSIRFGGRSLQTLIDEGILTPHATSCTCSACCDDETAFQTGPVRLFTPYKRRKRREHSDGEGGPPRKIRPHPDSNGEESCDSAQATEILGMKESWGTAHFVTEALVDGEGDVGEPVHVTATTAVTATVVTTSPSAVVEFTATAAPAPPTQAQASSTSDLFKRLDEMSSKLVKMSYSMRKAVEEARDCWQLEREQIREQAKRDTEQAVLEARVEAQVACSRAVFDSTVHVVDPINPVGLQPTTDSNDSKKCANCNRDAFAECSLCRRTPYCSTFCQRKDWASHQVECVHSASDQGSIMLIVESSDQVLTAE